ncbi:MAG: hypothetical protein C4303_05560, partial [candidate division GAL15 bacterium]
MGVPEGQSVCEPRIFAAGGRSGLKRTNEVFGHPAGDALLRAVAHAIRRTVRSTDLVFRIGGDEFAVLLPDTESDGAGGLVKRCVNTH